MLFLATCLLASWSSGQAAVEFGAGSATWSGRSGRLAGLALTALQTAGLVGMMSGVTKRLHLQWMANWSLGSFLFNVNFPDWFQLSPRERWNGLHKMQVGGPLVSGLLTWAAMLVPVFFFMAVVAPLLQSVAFVPLRLALRLFGAFHARYQRRPLGQAATLEGGRGALFGARCGKASPLLGGFHDVVDGSSRGLTA